ncbi:hypothetical protein H072_3690 [Dactylellina haptotyla CBS 200.50]|uniref:DUF7029 domain-containing protein n=1 Tax=Dactylellina haptotyla (strain CBS 200.50) TaxID=1284197 RepID=S8AMQ4_DACHA|nr:hypothetical protein H072_3690 [Dactylellina haptotyla CBS 200.50]
MLRSHLYYILLLVAASTPLAAFEIVEPAPSHNNLIPGIHWETDTADYEHLIPSSHVTVFYSNNEVNDDGKIAVAHLWAEYFTDVVALEHSNYVESVHCGEPGDGGIADMTITFNDNKAYELAKKKWSPYGELLFIGANFTHTACFPDVHLDSNRFWVMSQIAFPVENDSNDLDVPNHITFRSLPIRFHEAIKDVDIKFGNQQKPLPGTHYVYKRNHPLSPTTQKGPQLIPRAEPGDSTTGGDIITTEEITLEGDLLSNGPDDQLANVTSEFIAADTNATAEFGFGAFPDADNDASLLSPDEIDPNYTSTSTYPVNEIIATDTNRVDSGVPTPTTTPRAFENSDGPISISSYNGTDPFVLVETANGNLVRRDNSSSLATGESRTFISQGGLIVSDDAERMFTLYADEIQAFGVSRIRLHKQDLVPKTALYVTFVPLRVEGLQQGILAVSTTDSKYYAPVICDLQGQDSKVFVVRFDTEDYVNEGLAFLQSEAARNFITGGIVSTCYTVMLTDGNGGLPVRDTSVPRFFDE